MRNIEILRDYFLGKDPQLKETMADNSLRLIGIPGREFVLKVDFFKALKDLRDALEEEKKARKEKDDELEGLINDLDTTLDGIVEWKDSSDFVYQNELDTALGDFYTKDQVDALVSTIPTFNIEIVQELPTEDISDSTIYLLAKQDGSGNDYYDEYIHVDGNWELIGSTSVDLTNYYTKAEADAKFVEDADLSYIERALRVDNDITTDIIYGAYKETVNDYNQSNVVEDANFSYMVVNVLKGNEYEITGKGGGNEDNRLWALYRTTGEILDKAPADAIYDHITLEPDRDSILILNFTDDLTYPYEVIEHRFQTMDDVNDMFVKKTGDTMSGALINEASITVGSRAQNSTVGSHSAVIGTLNTASGVRSVAEGQGTMASGMNAHAEGANTVAREKNTHAEGTGSTAYGENSHAEGNNTNASGKSSHSEGLSTTASGDYAHAEGNDTEATNSNAHAEGYLAVASGNTSHAEGFEAFASGDGSHAEGHTVYETINCTFSGVANATTYSCSPTDRMAVGDMLALNGAVSRIEAIDVANQTVTVDKTLDANNDVSETSMGLYRTAKATGKGAHAEGVGTQASANSAHAEGGNAIASGAQSHAEGWNCTASYYSCHAEGTGTTANTQSAHSEGYGTVARGLAQHAGGYYNVIDTTAAEGTAQRGTYLRIIGNAVNGSNRSNAYTLDWSGNGWFSGDVYVGSTSGTNKDAGSKKLATVDQIPSITYSTTDLTPGVSQLDEGALYFVYS